MKKRFLFFVFISFLLFSKFNAYSQPSWLWAEGIPAITYDACNSVTTDAIGNLYSTGNYANIVDFDPGPGIQYLGTVGGGAGSDAYVLKLGPAGLFSWAFSIGGPGHDEGISITTDAVGDIYVLGRFMDTVDFDPGPGILQLISHSPNGNDLFILKLSSAGNFIWAKNIGGISGGSPLHLTTDANLNVYATGYFFGTADFDPGPGTLNLTSPVSEDIFVVKLNSIGNLVWAVNMGGLAWDQGNGIAVDAQENVFITGSISDTADMDPGPGIFNLIPSSNDNPFACKLNGNGTFNWAIVFGNGSGFTGRSIALDAASNVYLGGWFSDTADFDPSTGGVFNLYSIGGVAAYISKLDSTGNFIWAKAMRGGSCYSLLLDPNNDIIVSGRFAGQLNCDPDVTNFTLSSLGYDDGFIARFDSAGNFIWAKTIGGVDIDYLNSIALTTTGNIYVAGTSLSQTMSFDSITVTSSLPASPVGIFIAKTESVITSIKSVSTERINIYPNPTTDRIHIELPDYTGLLNVNICDMQGRKLFENNFMSERMIEINSGKFAVGIYLLNVFSVSIQVTKKIVIGK